MDSTQPPPGTTVLSTVALRSGQTQIVIALLKVSDRLELKVLEVSPELTQLGVTLKEAEELRRAHYDVINNIQTKKSPVEELSERAEALLSSQETSPRVYTAMSRSISTAWEEVLSQLRLRARILDLNLNYHRWCSEFEDCSACTESLAETELPSEVEEMKRRLTEVRAGEREALARLGRTLAAGEELLRVLRTVRDSAGGGDSRPGQGKLAAALAVAQVEGWLESLHSQRLGLQARCSAAVRQLEECLELAYLTADLRRLQLRVQDRCACLSSTSDQLGDTSASASLLLHEHRRFIPEAKELQDEGLKMVRLSEELAERGHYGGGEGVRQSYLILEETARYAELLAAREELLTVALNFFNSAQQALIKLDQLEVRLSTGELGLEPDQLESLQSEVEGQLEEISGPVLQEGYKILEGTPTAEGVKRMVEQIENKKINLSVQCTSHKEENVRAISAYKLFQEKYNLLNSFLTSMEAYLSGVREMGEDLASAKDYLKLYKENLNDLQTKTPEIKALIAVGREVGGRKRTEIADSCLELESRWCTLAGQLEARISLLSSYVRALTLAQSLDAQLDIIRDCLESGGRGEVGRAEQAWISAGQLRLQLETAVTNFLQDSVNESCGGGLARESGRTGLGVVRNRTEERLSVLQSVWDERAGQRKRLWDDNMSASNKTVDWVSKLYDQLYPVLSPELHSARQLAGHVEHKLNTVVPEVRRALAEIQLRQETAQALLTKSEYRDPNESITERLRDLSTRLNAISADYQVLLEKMISFFNNLSQIENIVERGQREEVTSLPELTESLDNIRRNLEVDKKSVGSMFDLCHPECAVLLERIMAQEGAKGETDARTVETAVETLRYGWQRLVTSRESRLAGLQRRLDFDSNLKEIQRSLDGLSSKLLKSQGYGESLSEALAASRDFQAFERTIQLLEVKISDFVRGGGELCSSGGSGSGGGERASIERELSAIQGRWGEIQRQVKRSREKIELSIELYTLVQEAEDWFREGNRLLTTIVHRSTSVKTYREVAALLQELEAFFKPGELKQNERISRISNLVDQLYGIASGAPRSVDQVQTENREMFESFSQISSQLKSMSDKLRTPSPQPIIQFMEIDDRSGHKVQQTSTTFREYSSTIIHTTVREGLNPSPGLKIEELRKSPSPPPKKVKVCEDLAPTFTLQLSNATVDEGSSFRFKCKVSGWPEPWVRWEKDGVMVDEKNTDYKVTRTPEGECSLQIEETFVEDSARFSCIASNRAGSALTTALLSVVESLPEDIPSPPIFTDPLKTASVLEGSSLELKCSVVGVPLPNVQWFHGKACIDNEPAYNITYNNGDAVMAKKGVTKKDEGEYSCLATNIAGSVTTKARISVKCLSVSPVEEKADPPPQFVRELSNVMARAGGKVRLDSEVSGAERLDWTHDGRVVFETPEIKLLRDGNLASLVISEAYPKDAGVYCLKASNKGGSVVSSATLTVKGRLPAETEESSSDKEGEEAMEPARPLLQVPLKDLSVFEGKKVRLDCVIAAHPEPEVIWYHDGEPVKESADIQLLFHGDRCSLMIEEALVEDSGTYRVMAINSAGETSSQCHLNVTPVSSKTEPAKTKVEESAVLEVEEGKPAFKKLLSDTLVKAGETVCLECEVTGHPMPTVSWALNNLELQQSERIHMSQDAEGACSLKIKEVRGEDRGVYTARAVNQLGEAKCFSQLIVKCPVTLESLGEAAAAGHQLGAGAAAAAPSAPALLLSERPAFLELFTDQTVSSGTPVKFECIVTGKPTPKIRWLYNGEPVSGKDFLVSTSGPRQVLTIPAAKDSLTGHITCSAENSAGKANCSAKLTVTESNKVLDDIFDSTRLPEGGFELKRSVFVESSSSSHFSSSQSSTAATATTNGAKPHFEVKSFTSKSEATSKKVGDQPPVSHEVQKTSEYRNVDGVETRGETSVVKSSGLEVKSSQDSSQIGLLEKSSSGLVIGKRKASAPRFLAPLQGCIVDQDRPIHLEAILDGHPLPEVRWTKNTDEPLPSDATTSYSLGKAGLAIPSAAVRHAGRYSLVATNSAGSATSTADVVVKKSSFPPVLGRRLQAKTPVVGERLSLEVEVTGTPVPTVSWTKDGQTINAATIGYRLLSQGNCHSLIVDKVDKSHSGVYSALVRNSAGEARSLAEVLVVDPPPPETSSTAHTPFFTDLITGNSSEIFKTLAPNSTQTSVTTVKKPGESVVVKESFSSQKQVSMKVMESQETYDSSLEIKKNITIPEPPKILEPIKKPEPKPELLKTWEPIVKEEPLPEPETISKTQNEDLITESISTKSSLDFFKNIIKENEEEKKRSSEFKPPKEPEFKPFKIPEFKPPIEQEFTPLKEPEFKPPKEPELKPFKEPEFKPFKVPEFKPPVETEFKPFKESLFRPMDSVKPAKEPEPPKFPSYTQKPKIEPLDDYQFSKEVSSFSQNFSSQKIESHFEEFNLEPGPPPEIGFFPKSTVTKPKEEVAEKAKRLARTQRQLSDVEVPSGGVKVFPAMPPQEKVETKKFESYNEEIHKERKELVASPLLRPAAPDVPVRPSSPRPSAEGVAMERLWTTKLEHKPSLEHRPLSPSVPSAEAVAMEKLWSHKVTDSTLPSVWPPPSIETKETISTSTFQKEQFSESKMTSFESKIEPQPVIFQPNKFEPLKSDNKIMYVAEAHATHRSNSLPSESHFEQSTFLESSREATSEVVSEKILLPSEAKKIWPPGPPVIPEPIPVKKTFKLEAKQQIRSTSMPQGFDDIHLEPGPPPEIGFATPPLERRASYVEQIEQDLERDLEREPTRVLPGSVRTMPPPKRESSVESGKTYQRSSSLREESVRSYKPHKYSTVPRPSKFVKKSFESDYESDFEGTKIKARWTPWDSDTEEPKYRAVKPPPVVNQPPRPHSAQPTPVSLPVFKPIPRYEAAKKAPLQDSGYMADTDEPHRTLFKKGGSGGYKSEKIFQTSKHEKVSMKQEKKFEKKDSSEKMESFVSPASAPSAAPSWLQSRSTRSSDWEGVELSRRSGAGFQPLLKPGSPPELAFAAPPSQQQPLAGLETSQTLNYAETTGLGQKFVSMKQTTRVLGLDTRTTQRQTSLPTKVIPAGEAKWRDVQQQASTEEEETSSSSWKRSSRHSTEVSSRSANSSSVALTSQLQPGEPPQYDYAPPIVPLAAANVVNKSLSEMTSSFKSKAQQFVSEVASDVAVRQNGKPGPILKQQSYQREPQVYREETRHSERGTKEIDPNTGLIYFKYDFGYEFGVVSPGQRGWVVGKQTKPEEPGVPFPVLHETSGGGGGAGGGGGTGGGAGGGYRKKTVKWDSESELSALSPSPHHHLTSGGGQQQQQDWVSGGSSQTSSPLVVNQMLHSPQPLKPPSFTTPLRDIAVVSGRGARFECLLEGHPQPTVSWRKAGEEGLGPGWVPFFRNGVCRLDLPAAFHFHGGEYICTASNSCGSAETSARLTVSGEEEGSSERPFSLWQEPTNRGGTRQVHMLVEAADGRSKQVCPHCEKPHRIMQCRTFKRMSVLQRREWVSKEGRCFLCCGKGHRAARCRSPRRCGVDGCQALHHSLLHTDRPERRPDTPDPGVPEEPRLVAVSTESASKVLLKVLPVRVKGPLGTVTVAALLDEGADCTLIDEALAQSVGLDGRRAPLCIQWVQGETSREEESRVGQLTVSGVREADRFYQLQRVRTVRGLALPPQEVDKQELYKRWPLTAKVPLNLCREAPLLLIGQDNWSVMTGLETFRQAWNGLGLTKTRLGWVVHGQLGEGVEAPVVRPFHVCQIETPDEELHQLVKSSFAVEEFGASEGEKTKSSEELKAIEILDRTSRFLGDRWEVGKSRADRQLRFHS